MKYPFIMAPIKVGYGDKTGKINDRFISFYKRRSEGIGAITPEPFYLDSRLRELPTQMGIDDDTKIEGLQQLTSMLHDEQVKVIAHLNHPGRMVNPNIPKNLFLSSTDKPCPNGGAIPKRMDLQDVKEVIRLFVAGAKRAEKAGFDAVELQFGHGYLLAQFLSPVVNDRMDEYGGSFENRVRFPLEVLKNVVNKVKIPVIVRVSGDEMIPEGISLKETLSLVKLLKKHGASAVHVSAGTVCSTPPWFFQHMFIPKGKTWEFAHYIQERVDLPIIYVGRINSIQDINQLHEEYNASYIALGRALVADPDFLKKYHGNSSAPIRPCLACSDGCLGGVKSGEGLQCVVNPEIGLDETGIQPADVSKSFAVVGGGLAGMQAAITLDDRGHQVTLYEKDQLGGQFNLAYLPPNKDSLKGIIDYYLAELDRRNIQVFMQEATVEKLVDSSYDGVVLATGSKPAIPPITGLSTYYWAECLLDENLPVEKKVVVIGAGLIGVEIASNLVDKKNDVYLVEMMDEIARGMEMIEKKLTLQKLSKNSVTVLTDTRVIRIDGQKVFLDGANEMTVDKVDVIVVATGMKEHNPLESSLKDYLPVYVVGDAKKVGKAKDAIRSGFETAKMMM
jgi:2,4-dienoyl-CoA reductase-like NADH-dependent reductase (Old Yellow Enzyme family)/thioredoxin reductase